VSERLSSEDLAAIAFEAYRRHGWPMDPVDFLREALRYMGFDVEDGE
jgi:hypothetical protein